MQEQQNNQKEHADLYKRSIKGGYWVVFTRIAITVLGLGKTLFIANYFRLNDLGIISAAVMMMEILSTFTQTGFESALIQKKGDAREYLDTAWTAGIIKGIMLFLILFFAAPLMASFKIPEEKVPLAIGVFRAMSVCFLIGGFRNIGSIYFSKNLEFHKTFALSITSTLTDIVLSIGLILIFQNIWGVIIARLITACVNCAGTYFLSSYRPRFHFIPSKARELWTFGRWIFGANILGYILEAGDDYFVWFYLGIQPLALYRYAFKFAMMPTTNITHVVSQVSFPAYSKIQDDKPRLLKAYLKVFQITTLLSIPAAFLIFVLGPDFVRLMKPHLYPMIPALQVLAVVGLITSIGSVIGPVLKATETLRPVLYLQWVRIILLAIFIYPLTKMWGIVGTASAIASVRVIMYLPGLYYASRIMNCSMTKMNQPLFLPLIASVLMSLAVVSMKVFVLKSNNYITFSLEVLLAFMLYSVSIWVMDSIFDIGVRSVIKEQFSGFFKEKTLNLRSN